MIDQNKLKIIEIFNKNVKGILPDTSSQNAKHAGRGGHWLEVRMGIKHNANNAPDIYGYEMKNDTTSKTTFGDWSADYYIFKSRGNKESTFTKSDFLKTFGKPNALKNNRYSWSGEPCPKVGTYNIFGQIIKVDSSNNIVAVYRYDKDKRSNKHMIVPPFFRKGEIVLAIWSSEYMKKKVERKFNDKGWFKCIKSADGTYTEIVFGEPINFNNWIELVKSGKVFLDSGMYEGNSRNYSQWRAVNNYWNSLITSRY